MKKPRGHRIKAAESFFDDLERVTSFALLAVLFRSEK